MTFQPVVKLEELYLGDNGRLYCGAHLGQTAKYTGRDLSGQPIEPVTTADVVAAGYQPSAFTCEEPGCGRGPAS